jgi:murein DD-endopeptidase MepM/ murein hydrolase activator NlpD
VLALFLVAYAIGASRVEVTPEAGAPAGNDWISPSPDAPRAADQAGATGPVPPPPSVAVPPEPEPGADARPLSNRRLLIPVAGVGPRQLSPSFDVARGSRRHEALDIMAPRGTPVLAVEDGTIAKLFTSKAGGLTVYQFDSSGRYAYYYAHLDRYAEGLREGGRISRGDPIGTVGSTGNASPDAPHLHFAIFALGPERRWWEGEPIDPYPILSRSEPHLDADAYSAGQ